MAAYLLLCRLDGAKKWMGVGLMRGGVRSVGSRLVAIECLWVDGMGWRGLRCSKDLGVWACAVT